MTEYINDYYKTVEKNTTTIELQNTNIWSSLSELKSELEKIVDLPKTQFEEEKSIQEEKDVLNLLKNITFSDGFEKYFEKWATIKKIQDWIFWVISNKTWNLNYYVDKNWKILFWIFSIKDWYFIKNWKAQETAWYKEIKENWKFNMYHIDENWDIIWNPIDINSKEYYQAWLNIMFYDDVYSKLYILRKNIQVPKERLDLFIQSWSFTFEDLELFFERKLIDKESFDYWVEEIRKILPKQCIDTRLMTLIWIDWKSLWITESKLKRYYEKGYISNDDVIKCFNLIPDEMKNLKD